MGDWAGTVPTVLAGYVPSGDDWSAILLELTAVQGALTSWSPTLTNLTLGNGTQTAKYRRVGKICDVFWEFTLGSTSAVGTVPTVTLPFSARSGYNGQAPMNGTCLDSGVTRRQLNVSFSGTGAVFLEFWNATPATASITATAPFTWGTNDSMAFWGTYELA